MCQCRDEKLAHRLSVCVEQLLVTLNIDENITAIRLNQIFNKYLLIINFFGNFFYQKYILRIYIMSVCVQMLSVSASSVSFRVVFQGVPEKNC